MGTMWSMRKGQEVQEHGSSRWISQHQGDHGGQYGASKTNVNNTGPEGPMWVREDQKHQGGKGRTGDTKVDKAGPERPRWTRQD